MDTFWQGLKAQAKKTGQIDLSPSPLVKTHSDAVNCVLMAIVFRGQMP